MSYESINNNSRPQQTIMINSNYYNPPSSQSQMTHSYQPYPSPSSSHQTVSLQTTKKSNKNI